MCSLLEVVISPERGVLKAALPRLILPTGTPLFVIVIESYPFGFSGWVLIVSMVLLSRPLPLVFELWKFW